MGIPNPDVTGTPLFIHISGRISPVWDVDVGNALCMVYINPPPRY